MSIDAADVVGTLDRVWRMVGSERLTQLRFGDDGHGNHIGAEFAEALRRAHDDLGVRHVRAHAILHDDNRVVTRAADGGLAFDFSAVDALYDQLLEIGLRPVVELSFMPAAIARDPEQTVFVYRGIISPPRDWTEWHDVVAALASHLVERYGIDEVAHWAFEVWNEPNLEVFWSGTPEEYLRLYDESARAIKSVDPRLRVGGPSTAAGEWVESLARYAAQHGVALDFASTHTYGNLPLDVRPSLRRHGFDGVPIWWTEWGVGSTHFGPIHDGVIGAPFVLSGFAAAQGSWTRWRTGWSATTSRSWAGHPACSTTGSACSASETCASHGTGPCTLRRTSATMCWKATSTVTELTCLCRPGPPATTTAQSMCLCGTARSTPH